MLHLGKQEGGWCSSEESTHHVVSRCVSEAWSSMGLGRFPLSLSISRVLPPPLQCFHFPYSNPSPHAPTMPDSSSPALPSACTPLLGLAPKRTHWPGNGEGKAQGRQCRFPSWGTRLRGVSVLSPATGFHLILQGFVSLRPLLSLPVVGEVTPRTPELLGEEGHETSMRQDGTSLLSWGEVKVPYPWAESLPGVCRQALPGALSGPAFILPVPFMKPWNNYMIECTSR